MMGPDAMIFVFWILSFKSIFSLSTFTFIKKILNNKKRYFLLLISPSFHYNHWYVSIDWNIWNQLPPLVIWKKKKVISLTKTLYSSAHISACNQLSSCCHALGCKLPCIRDVLSTQCSGPCTQDYVLCKYPLKDISSGEKMLHPLLKNETYI